MGRGDSAAHLRPTTDRVREALFNTLAGGRYGDPLTDASVLDLFAGTGALGLEALSRGAQRAVFVDDGRVAGKLLRENITTLGAKDRARVISRDATRIPAAGDTTATLVFLDPPYGTDLGARALSAALAAGWVAPDALIVWEDNGPQCAPKGWAVQETRRYGDTTVTFLSQD